MRNFMTGLLVLSFASLGTSQINYFDNQYDSFNHFEILGKVLVLDSLYLVVGKYGSITENLDGRLLMWIDLEGEKKRELRMDSLIYQERINPHFIEQLSDTLSILQGTKFYNNPDNTSDLILTKLNHYSGDTIWNKFYGNDTLTESTAKTIRTNDGGFAIAGWSFKYDWLADSTIYQQRMLLVKTDSLGNLEYAGRYTSDSLRVHFASSLVNTPDKGFLIVGHMSKPVIKYRRDSKLLKVDSLGQVEWWVSYEAADSVGSHYVYEILPTADGNYLIGGNKIYIRTDIPNRVDLFQRHSLMKVNPMGDIIWEKEYSQNDWVGWARGICTSKGTFVFCGYEKDYNTDVSPHFYGVLCEIDSTGNLLWYRKYRSSPDDQIYSEYLLSVKETPDGGYVAVGRGYGEPGDSTYQNAWVIKTDSVGCLQPNCDSISTGVQYLYPPERGTLVLAPNPVRDWLRLWVAEEEVERLEIYDLSGRLVLLKQYEEMRRGEAVELSVVDWSAGMYVVRVRTDVGWRTGKVVRE